MLNATSNFFLDIRVNFMLQVETLTRSYTAIVSTIFLVNLVLYLRCNETKNIVYEVTIGLHSLHIVSKRLTSHCCRVFVIEVQNNHENGYILSTL